MFTSHYFLSLNYNRLVKSIILFVHKLFNRSHTELSRKWVSCEIKYCQKISPIICKVSVFVQIAALDAILIVQLVVFLSIFVFEFKGFLIVHCIYQIIKKQLLYIEKVQRSSHIKLDMR